VHHDTWGRIGLAAPSRQQHVDVAAGQIFQTQDQQRGQATEVRSPPRSGGQDRYPLALSGR